MKTADFLRSSTFRLVISYMVLFAGSVLLLLSFIYWSTVSFMVKQTDAAIISEQNQLISLYREQGLPSLISTISERSADKREQGEFYAVTGPGKKILAGNLLGRPEAARNRKGWMNFQYGDTAAVHRVRQIRARILKLDEEHELIVGRDRAEHIALHQVIVKALLWGLFIMLVLAILGGIIMSRRVLRHIEQFNRTTREIMAGDLQRRMPVRGSTDEFDQLAKNLNAMLDEIARLMDGIRQVSNNVAHDLRTPLARLRNNLEILRDEIGSGTPHSQLVERSLDDADQLLSTFNSLLRIARIEAGGLKAKMEQVDLASLIQDAVELYEAVAEVKQIQINTKIQDPVTVMGDRDMLFQAVANLLDNAIKYTRQGGRVVLSVEQLEQVATIAVADNGPGIPAIEYDRVLQRFYRLDQSRNTAGNGLGLSLVEAVVNLHKATLTFEDNEPGLKVTIQFKPEIWAKQ